MATTKLLLFATVLVFFFDPHVAADSVCPTVLWSDEFDGTSLNTSNWEAQTGNGCEYNVCGWGNAEAQYYRAENAEVSDGKLKIIAKKERYQNFAYTSARLRTINLAEIDLTQPHILLEARIKVPSGGYGIWPAFWMMPSPEVLWPTGGELDIMEFIGREPNLAQGYMHYGNLYNDKSIKGGPLKFASESPANDFHVYAIEKTPNKIAWLIDGYEYQSYTSDDIEPKFTWPFESKFHFILNVAVGGNWPGWPDDTTTFPTAMEVDYVRVTDLSSVQGGKITGKTLVQINQQAVTYCIEDSKITYAAITWEVPLGSQVVSTSGTCATIDFGTSSGFVKALAESGDCGDKIFSIPVEVQPKYKKEFGVMQPTENIISQIVSTGSMQYVSIAGEPVLQYNRNITALYDVMQIETDFISNPDLYVTEEKKFYMDIMSTTAAPCTRVFIQLEDSSLIGEYPAGRHSRHVAYIDGAPGWERLEFDFYDRLDRSVSKVDSMTVLIDSGVFRGDRYLIKNFDSTTVGCTENCEALSTAQCRKESLSEAGACTDGINNDMAGYSGDDPQDCDDSDCYGLDPACIVNEGPTTPAPSPVPTFPAPTASPSTSAPTPMPTSNPTSSPTVPSPTVSPTMHPTTSPTTPSPTVPPTQQPTNPPSKALGLSECSAYSVCAKLNLNGNCCPTDTNIYLDCCFESMHPTASPTTPSPSVPPTQQPTNPPSKALVPSECSAYSVCAKLNLNGNCCPTDTNIYLDCCFESQKKQGYAREFSFVNPSDSNERASYFSSSAPYYEPASDPEGNYPVVSYKRDVMAKYDIIYYKITESISNAKLYVSGEKKFFIDVYSTAPKCTQIIIQLDDLSMAEPTNYPSGRHSRYVALTTTSNSWERIEFDFLDQPDPSVPDNAVDAMVVLFDPGNLSTDNYYFKNFDSATRGCTDNCESPSTKSCADVYSGESGDCSDGVNNGLNGQIDCNDPDCTASPACSAQLRLAFLAAEDRLVLNHSPGASADMKINSFRSSAGSIAKFGTAAMAIGLSFLCITL